jgi:aspartyl-tRNA synthetase
MPAYQHRLDRESSQLPLENGHDKQYAGLMGKPRHVSKKLSFADITLPSGQVIQICSRADDDAEAHAAFRQIPAHSPIVVRVREDPTEIDSKAAKPTFTLETIQPLNSVPDHFIVTPETIFPPNKRHLQIRFHPELQARLRFRSWLKGVLNQSLLEKGFTDVETPTLFKTTPEGAREFLVPTRAPGKAYALTQSPQQYKQSLIASGIGRYMQWARCYRDEDSRADRQPEFTQLDMEWAFAGRERVQKDITDIVLNALAKLRPAHSYQDVRGERVPLLSNIPKSPADASEPEAHKFTTLTFAECIASYGIDKPDLRIPGKVRGWPNPYSETKQY